MQLTHSELIHDRSRRSLRTVYSDLAREAGHIDAAVDRIRLSGIDLAYEELASVKELRVLITEINAATLKFEAEAILADPQRGDNLRVVMRLLAEERLRVRCAPLLDWAPNFPSSSIRRDAALCSWVSTGSRFHALRGVRPLAVVHRGREAVGVRARFQEMWDLAHDIGPGAARCLRGGRARNLTR